jgi:very-short-patch-repair endonuclease
MPRNSNHASKFAAVASVARRQEGLVSRGQLEACGVGDGQLEHWVREGRLTPVLHTVFAVGDPTLGPRARMRAAALACPGAVVSHRSAAALLGIGEVAPFVLDLAGTYGEDGLRKTFERVAAEGKVRSLFEAKLLPLVAAAGLPMPRINAPVRTAERVLEVDLLWDDERFVVEADSRRHHGTEVAFERDRKRDLELMEVHYEVLRVSWKQVEREPQKVFAVVRSELERRSERWPKKGAAA